MLSPRGFIPSSRTPLSPAAPHLGPAARLLGLAAGLLRPSVRLLGLAAALAALLASAPSPAPAQEASGAPSARALADSLEEGITRASLRGDRERLAGMVRLAHRAREAHPSDPWIRHYLGYALYRSAVAEMAEGGPAGADETLARAQEVLEASALEDSIPESFALLGSTLGMRIGADPQRRARTLGPKVDRYLRAAAEAGPRNPRVRLVRGIDAFHTPEQYGGGAEKARRQLEKALELFGEESVAPPAPGWGRAQAHAYLGQLHARAGRTEKARAEYQKALEIRPGFAWVKHRLLPAVGDGSGGSDESGGSDGSDESGGSDESDESGGTGGSGESGGKGGG